MSETRPISKSRVLRWGAFHSCCSKSKCRFAFKYSRRRTFLGNFSSFLPVLFPHKKTSMIFHKPDVESTVAAILSLRKGADSRTSVLAGVSGIDGSGKGFVTDRIIE